jgi:hypothetical protein
MLWIWSNKQILFSAASSLLSPSTSLIFLFDARDQVPTPHHAETYRSPIGPLTFSSYLFPETEIPSPTYVTSAAD